MKDQNKISLKSVRDHNHELLEIILRARELSTEDRVVETLNEALKAGRKVRK